MLTAIISLLFWLVVIPFCIGLIPVNYISPSRRNFGVLFLAGYFCMWALFALAAIPAVLWVEYDNFKVASSVFTALSILCAILGIVMWRRNRADGEESLLGVRIKNDSCVIKKNGLKGLLKNVLRADRIEWLLFFLLLGFQLYKAAAFASFDGDDAYYVVESLLAQEADTMYRILPYSGGSTGLDVRHVLAVFPMWVAFVAVKAGIHATIVSHVVMPFVLIPLPYLLYHEIGKHLFDSEEAVPVFMIIMAVFQVFGNVSIYTNETFFLTRTWQGKAVAGSLVIPALLWLFLLLGEEREQEKRADMGLWLLFVCVNMTAGICSSIAVFLASILTALTAFALMITKKDIRLLLRFGAACIPNVIYMGIYVVMGYSYLLK